MGDQKLTERLTIPITPKMREHIDTLGEKWGIRAVDVGRMALVYYLEMSHIYRHYEGWPRMEEERDEPNSEGLS